MDWLCLASFSIEIIFNCCRQHEMIDGTLVRSHYLILKNYLKSGGLIMDLIATAPLYLLENKNFAVFKLIRLIRLPRLASVFSIKRSGWIFNFYVQSGTLTQRIFKKFYVK